MDAGEESVQHRPGEPRVPPVHEQAVLPVETARLHGVQLSCRSDVRRGLLRADHAGPIRLHRLRQEVQVAGQSEEAPESGLRQQGEKILLSHVRSEVQVPIRIEEPYHRTSWMLKLVLK